MNTISRTLALLKPADLFPAWKWIDLMEQCGEIEADEARRWKEGVYGLMVLYAPFDERGRFRFIWTKKTAREEAIPRNKKNRLDAIGPNGTPDEGPRSVLLLDRPKVTRLHVRNSTIEFRHITGL